MAEKQEIRKPVANLVTRFREPYSVQIEIVDESMVPDFPVGSIVYCSPINPHRLKEGKAYVFETMHGFRLATYEYQHKRLIHLSCLNKAYSFIEPIRRDQMLRVYKVDLVASRMEY
ncbi:hypothetical protein [Arsenicibacter rosenii]|uniref:Peptidase S24/S26A/S26B/S26C domain-containing protein n=1 Tax=Arsenicibacter rosenii TaxID=1750698 RepID=A0A1S2VCA5_9BACT|nr:hypothetical protein [Arsenicibacter rosenii]OIN56322.1 hypothetical protein BLX24_25140 [Arsenicibacter rosenii]